MLYKSGLKAEWDGLTVAAKAEWQQKADGVNEQNQSEHKPMTEEDMEKREIEQVK